MKALLVCEDPKLDAFILRPILSRILKDAGKPKAKVDICDRRSVGQGIAGLTKNLPAILAQYRMHKLIVVVIDRDANQPTNHESRMQYFHSLDERVVGVCAVEEVEVWMLGLYPNELGEAWQKVRAERNVKERFAAPFLRQADFGGPGRGRSLAMRALSGSGSWSGLLSRCPEISELRQQIKDRLASS